MGKRIGVLTSGGDAPGMFAKQFMTAMKFSVFAMVIVA